MIEPLEVRPRTLRICTVLLAALTLALPSVAPADELVQPEMSIVRALHRNPSAPGGKAFASALSLS